MLEGKHRKVTPAFNTVQYKLSKQCGSLEGRNAPRAVVRRAGDADELVGAAQVCRRHLSVGGPVRAVTQRAERELACRRDQNCITRKKKKYFISFNCLFFVFYCNLLFTK